MKSKEDEIEASLPIDETKINILFQGITGSHAYGMNRPASDTDHKGVFAFHTDDLFGLTPATVREETLRETEPYEDRQLHEARRYVELGLRCNPGVLDLLWLPDDLVEVRTDIFDELIVVRKSFLSAPEIERSYVNYAIHQLGLLRRHFIKDGGGDIDGRPAKHARHIARLLHQGLGLYQTGDLRLRVEDPEWYFEFGKEASLYGPDAAQEEISRVCEIMDNTVSPLPEIPDTDVMVDWLHRVRWLHLQERSE